jgi:hypothetical protein
MEASMSDELTQHAVIRTLTLPHTPDGQIEHFAEHGQSLGMRPNEHPATTYAPGHTVFLTPSQAAEYMASGHVAPAGCEDAGRMIARAQAEDLGLLESPPASGPSGELTTEVDRAE